MAKTAIRYAWAFPKGKGKSGGSRVITCVKVLEQDVYLLSIYDKSDKESITDKELDNLLQIAGLG